MKNILFSSFYADDLVQWHQNCSHNQENKLLFLYLGYAVLKIAMFNTINKKTKKYNCITNLKSFFDFL
jgi:hypothetical protein